VMLDSVSGVVSTEWRVTSGILYDRDYIAHGEDPPNNQLQLTRKYIVACASRWVYAGSPRS